jgi:predicted peptidase
LDEVEKTYAVDPARVYLPGHSMGGATRLKDMPIWAFHGAKDSLVPIGDDQELINALKALGNVVRFTVLPGREHNILDVYENQELYSWFLEHARPVR